MPMPGATFQGIFDVRLEDLDNIHKSPLRKAPTFSGMVSAGWVDITRRTATPSAA